MHDYQQPDAGWCGDPKRGAAMGRGSDLSRDTTAALSIRKVPLDSGGYDPGGTYWGAPDDLYCVSDEDGAVSYQRGASFDAVKAMFPHATWQTLLIVAADFDDMVQGYAECALWSSNDESTPEGGEPFDANYSVSDITPETMAGFRQDCIAFVEHNALTFAKALHEAGALDWSRIGHDFWLSRNGHGCGFGDRGSEYGARENGKALDEACGWRTKFGEVHLYLADDGTIGCE